MRRIGYIYDRRYLTHMTGPSHPERPARVEAVDRRIQESGLAGDLVALEAVPADPDWIATVHDAAYIERVKEACRRGDAILDSMDTGISTQSFDIALLATGAGLAAADAVMDGRVEGAFAAVRPPGHHALAGTAMGFCLFNSVAVLARYLQKKHGLRRIFIVDWDVHHGNGTQAMFWEDPDVFYYSIHQYPFYPGTGAASEIGAGQGKGTTLNSPMSPGCDDDVYRREIDAKLIPALRSFRPEALIISAGFDAHRADPLAGMELTEEGYAHLTKTIVEAAAPTCKGRVLSLLEGGYDLEALSSSTESHLRSLLSP